MDFGKFKNFMKANFWKCILNCMKMNDSRSWNPHLASFSYFIEINENLQKNVSSLSLIFCRMNVIDVRFKFFKDLDSFSRNFPGVKFF